MGNYKSKTLNNSEKTKEVVINLIEKEKIRKKLQDKTTPSETKSKRAKKKRKPLPGGMARTQQK